MFILTPRLAALSAEIINLVIKSQSAGIINLVEEMKVDVGVGELIAVPKLTPFVSKANNINSLNFTTMATTPKRDAIQKAVVTLKDVKLMTSANAFVFIIEENNIICQIDSDGNDAFTDAFSKPFNCVLSTFKSNIPPMKKLRRKVCNNPMGFSGVEEPMFMILDELTGQKIEITRHFGHMGDVVNGFALPKDKWVTDTIALVDEKAAANKFDDDFNEDFKECLSQIERDDDF